MSKLRELKLKDVETLSGIQLMSASGSGSGSESGSGGGSWSGGGGTSESNCMSQDLYDTLIDQGASVKNVWVCGLGYITVDPTEVWGSGSGDNSGGGADSGSGGNSGGGADSGQKWTQLDDRCTSQVGECYAYPCSVRNNENGQTYRGECRVTPQTGSRYDCGCMALG